MSGPTWVADVAEMRRRTAAINKTIADAVRTLVATKGAASRSDVIAAVCARRTKDDPAEIKELVGAQFRRGRFGYGGRARIEGDPG